MITKTGFISVLVKDYDKAIEFYTQKFGFTLTADMNMGNFRWVTVAPNAQSETVYTLMVLPPDTPQVTLPCFPGPMSILISDDCRKDVTEMQNRGVEVVKPATDEFWGIDAWVQDLDGNIFNIVQMPEQN